VSSDGQTFAVLTERLPVVFSLRISIEERTEGDIVIFANKFRGFPMTEMKEESVLCA